MTNWIKAFFSKRENKTVVPICFCCQKPEKKDLDIVFKLCLLSGIVNRTYVMSTIYHETLYEFTADSTLVA